MRVGPALVDVDGRHQWPLEAGLSDPDLPPASARPVRIVNVDDVEPEEEERGEFRDTFRQLGRAAGSVRTGLNHSVVRAASSTVRRIATRLRKSFSSSSTARERVSSGTRSSPSAGVTWSPGLPEHAWRMPSGAERRP